MKDKTDKNDKGCAKDKNYTKNNWIIKESRIPRINSITTIKRIIGIPRMPRMKRIKKYNKDNNDTKVPRMFTKTTWRKWFNNLFEQILFNKQLNLPKQGLQDFHEIIPKFQSLVHLFCLWSLQTSQAVVHNITEQKTDKK